MKITVAGAGYMGLANAIFLSQENDVILYDDDIETLQMIGEHVSPYDDSDMQAFLTDKRLNLKVSEDCSAAYKDAEYVIIHTLTKYDEEINFYNTTSVENTISNILKVNSSTVIIIKSSVPVGFTERMRAKYKTDNIIFSPDFLREGKSLYDCLYPSRLVIGDKSDKACKYAELMTDTAGKKDIPVFFTNSTEAETVKMFANSYLAMRVAFFNELDSYAETRNLESRQIIDAVCSDPRIGDLYNNPSFGYGGEYLPKDTKQLLSNYAGIPQNMISAIIDSNKTRKEHVARMIIDKNPKTVGVYRLTMSNNSASFRHSAIQDVLKMLTAVGIEVIIYEPSLEADKFFNSRVVKDFDEFKNSSDIILVNRYSHDLDDIKEKVYTRDIFERD